MRQSKKFKAYPFDYHQEIEVEIDALSNLGVGIARVQIDAEDPGFQSTIPGLASKKSESVGWVVFVPHTLPGEKVLARIFRNDKSHSQGDLVKVIEPSPDRLEPNCELFGKCGGCQYQHLSYEKQLTWKTRQVEELLQHMAGVETTVSPAIPSPKQWGYRSKITPHFKRPRDGKIVDSFPSREYIYIYARIYIALFNGIKLKKSRETNSVTFDKNLRFFSRERRTFSTHKNQLNSNENEAYTTPFESFFPYLSLTRVLFLCVHFYVHLERVKDGRFPP